MINKVLNKKKNKKNKIHKKENSYCLLCEKNNKKTGNHK